MKSLLMVMFVWVLCSPAHAADLKMNWAYHDDADDVDDRDTELVPGLDVSFIKEGATVCANDSSITLYILTDHDFAGELEEQIHVRWWNGEEEHWVMGAWENNVRVGVYENKGEKFHALPRVGNEMIDIWKVEIGPELTKPGENFYVIQLKGWAEGRSEEAFLLRDSAGLNAEENQLGQAWTGTGDYFDHDWSVTVVE